MVGSGLSQVPVLGADGAIRGFLEEVDVARVYLAAMSRRAPA
jgi:hypothetical protein